MDGTPGDGNLHRRIALAVAGALALASLGSAAAVSIGRLPLEPLCGPGAEPLRLPGQPTQCVPADQPPPGVDVTERVPTAELVERPGAGPTAIAAAEDLGVASAEEAAEPSSEVPCDGDGVSGYRVQAMYVVEAGRTNRYASLASSMRLWAAGANDVFNRSAALTGGVRNLRYVTDPGAAAGTCVARVLNVTVPAGSTSSFNRLVGAVQGLGHDDPTRKYLMWADASVLCGVAGMYPVDSAAQSDPNNGSYAQYARVDQGCWGLPNRSVEAHELVHTFGGVQSTAPHGTRAGHCYDESDRMCYADGGGFAMQQVCPPDNEPLLDCNSDDYFSTYPQPGSYLDTRWNSANSRFLIGGGNGSTGGSTGSPTTLGARIAVNNPAVPGLVTQVSVTPALPQGRTLASVAWKSARADCTFATPTELQSTVQCAATAVAATTVTATVTDSSGATKVVTSPLTFATGTARPVTVALSVAGQTSAPAMCTAAPTPVTATLVDTASNQPIKGLAATFTKQTAAMTAPAAAGTIASTGTGAATSTQTATVATTYSASTARTGVYDASTPAGLTATVAQCAPTLAAQADRLETYYGDPVTVTGTLTRSVGGSPAPVPNATVPVTLTSRTTSATGVVSTRVLTLGSARTAADGGFRLVVKPTTSGTLTASLPASTSYAATSRVLGELRVSLPQSTLTAVTDRPEVGYGRPVTVTGTLSRVTAAGTGPASGQTVALRVTAPGRSPVTIGSARTLTDGSFRVSVPLRVSGQLTAAYDGSAGLPAATVDLGAVTAGTWSTALTSTTSSSSTTAGVPVTLSGTLTRTYAGTTEPADRVPLKVSVQADGAAATVLSVTTSTSGTYSLRVFPRVSTTYTVRLLPTVGYTPTDAAPVRVNVG